MDFAKRRLFVFVKSRTGMAAAGGKQTIDAV
jgi:hypothetical protein